MRTSRTRHRLQAAAAVFGTVAVVYGISRLIAPSSPPPRPTTLETNPSLPPIEPRVDPKPSAPERPSTVLAFYAAVREGDLEAAKANYEVGTSLSGILHDAAASGNAELVAWLLDRGADVHEDERAAN